MSKIFLILLCFIGSLLAESGSSFRYGVNAKSISMGGSISSLYNPGFNGFSNPAFLTKVNKPEFGISFFKMSLDRSIQAFSYSRNLPPSAGIALSFFRSGIDEIMLTDINNNFIEKAEQWEGYGAMSFGFKFSDKASFGFTLKTYINELSYDDLIKLEKLLNIDDSNLYNFLNGLETDVIIEENSVTDLFKSFKYTEK